MLDDDLEDGHRAPLVPTPALRPPTEPPRDALPNRFARARSPPPPSQPSGTGPDGAPEMDGMRIIYAANVGGASLIIMRINTDTGGGGGGGAGTSSDG